MTGLLVLTAIAIKLLATLVKSNSLSSSDGIKTLYFTEYWPRTSVSSSKGRSNFITEEPRLLVSIIELLKDTVLLMGHTFSNCPTDYYNNCRNQLIKCKQCVAGTGNKLLFYESIDEGLPPHPYAKDQQKQRRQKRAKAVEESVLKDIAKGTVRSGAANGDGDIHLLNDELRVEVKDRGTRKSWNLTWEEYEKGLKQGIDIFAISVDCPDGKTRTIYMLEDQLFNDWLACVKQHL